MRLSFSTCWNSGRYSDGAKMLREIRRAGFTHIELGHGIRLPLMEGIQQLHRSGEFTFSSLHNFCPLPVEITRAAPDCYEFSSHRAGERERAFRLTLRTIDFAQRLGAPLVVLHLGSVPMRRYSHDLVALAEKGRHLDRAYVRTKLRAVRTRERRGPFYLARSRDALRRIAEYAGERGIRLGVESRQDYEDIPTERELAALLDDVNLPNVGYWHDFGHIQTKHNLGFLDHEQWLASIRHRLFGCHLHDCGWPADDHLVPFAGGVDYDRLIPLLPPDIPVVWELSPRRTKREIRDSLARWKTRFGPAATSTDLNG